MQGLGEGLSLHLSAGRQVYRPQGSSAPGTLPQPQFFEAGTGNARTSAPKTCAHFMVSARMVDEDILIRQADPTELDEIEALVKTAYREFQPLFPEQVWYAWMDNIKATVHSATGVMLVVERDRKIQGVVKFYPDAAQAFLGHWPQGAASMRILAVLPESRGKGYGILLVRECIERGRALKIPTIYLYTGTFMQAARHIYEKLGFRRTPEFDKDPGPLAYRLDL